MSTEVAGNEVPVQQITEKTAFAVGVTVLVVMLWTTTGAPPPTTIFPT